MQHEFFNQLLRPAAAILALLAAVPAAAQEPADDQANAPALEAPLFGEVVDVRVVNLEAVVTERGGQRISGLGPEDFVLRVDGAEVPIEYFTEVEGGVAASPHAGDMVPALAPGEPVGTSYLLFIDEFFSIGARRNTVLRRMIDQLGYLAPEDRMAVVAYNGRRLEMLSSWNQSIPEVERVLRDALNRPSYGMHSRGQERSFLATARSRVDPLPAFSNAPGIGIGGGGRFSSGFSDGNGVMNGTYVGFAQERLQGAASSTGLGLAEEHNVAWITERLHRVVTAATAAMRSFANPPGRKVMLLTSGGWPDNPTEFLLQGTGRYEISRAGDRNTIYGPLIETANRLSYTLYPIDVAGSSGAGADLGRATLRRLANQTGGRPMIAGDGLKALEKTVADTRSYYWLGFIPQWKGDDSAHRIRLDVRRSGLKVRTRQSFADLSRQREVSMMVESSLRLGDEATAVAFPVQVGDGVKKAGMGKVEVPLEMLVPVEELTFLPFGNQYVAEVELRVAVEDDHGTSTDIPVVPMKITLDLPPKEGEMRRWETRIKIRRAEHDVVVSLYDLASGKMLSSRLKVDPNSL